MPPAFSVSRKSQQNFVSRSCKAYCRWSRNPQGLTSGVASHLLHPCLIRVPRDPGQIDAAALQMDEEQNVVGHQATPSQDLYREEVDPGQHGQMRLNEFLPCRVLAPLRCRRDAMPLQDVPYS